MSEVKETVLRFVLKTAGQQLQKMRPGDQLAEARGSDVMGRIEKIANDVAQAVVEGMGQKSLEPMNAGAAANHIHFGARFVKQRR